MSVLGRLPALLRSARISHPGEKEHATVDEIRYAADQLSYLPDAALRHRLSRLREAVREGRRPDDSVVLIPAFALVMEAIRRSLNIVLYDVQLLAGMALARRAIAEMRTGEGKTFVACLPAALHALSGQGVHVMTVNSYLAQRDFELLAPAYRSLGLTVGLTQAGASTAEKADAYACDITYGPGYEFGFDYLRDQSALLKRPPVQLGGACWAQLRGRPEQGPLLTQRGHSLAIIDEIDSVLLDEATTPLILTDSAPTPAPDAEAYRAAARCAASLRQGLGYVLDPTEQSVRLTKAGLDAVSGIDDLPRGDLRRSWPTYVEQALKAQIYLLRDVDYVVDVEQKVRIVDATTGRIFKDREWRDGLQQAIQAKEKVPITCENQPVVRISRQRFFRLYEGLCGMTGTAQGSEREFEKTYHLGVVVIPPRKTSLRITLTMRAFVTQEAKHRAIVEEIVQVHRTGQPVLLGTATISESQLLAERLKSKSVRFQLLNGTQDEEEAHIVSRAGKARSVTIATNMAGRGTDIKLGPGVAELGGLYVIGCEPQPSSRVDRQLLGRAARQGDPGCGRIFVSAEDPLPTRFSPALVRRMNRLPRNADGEIAANLDADVKRLQSKMERFDFRRRWRLFLQDDWLESVLGMLASSS